jgi:hypothetical protein
MLTHQAEQRFVEDLVQKGMVQFDRETFEFKFRRDNQN